jgi:cytoskeleton protein RodZ
MNSHDSGASLTDKKRLTAGQVLAERREKLGLTIEECAETLKLSVSKMKALEADDDTPFSSEIFLRGYLKNYAKLVDLPASDVLYYYDSQRQFVSGDVEGADSQEGVQSNKKWWLPYALAAFIIAAWFVLSNDIELEGYLPADTAVLNGSIQVEEQLGQSGELLSGSDLGVDIDEGDSLLNKASEEVSNDTQLPEENEPTAKDLIEPVESLIQLQQEWKDGTPAESLPENSSTSSNIDNTSSAIDVPAQNVINTLGEEEQHGDLLNDSVVSSLDDPEEAQINVSLANTAPELDLPKALTTEASLVNDLLYFTFLEACWVEVIDATNKTIVSSIRKANSELLVEGRSPFSIILGNINGATLRFNDKPIDLANSSDGRTIRLTVGG